MSAVDTKAGTTLASDEEVGLEVTTPVRAGGPPILVSIVVPVYNKPRDLARCLSALRAAAGADTEVIVVDDASTDDVSSVAVNAGARLLRLARNVGPAAARNHGARHARGQVLFFVDADVVVAEDVMMRVRTFIERDPEIAAVFGSYNLHPTAPGLVSQYRNLLHHFVHQTGRAEASTFWAGCGAVRRAAFEHVGGFDERSFPRPSIEDIELGYRLRRAGYRILLDKSLQGMHLKRWTLWTVVRTDITHRAIPWSRLILNSKEAPDDLNLQRSQRLCVGLTGLSGIFFAASPLRPELLVPAFACAAATVVINRDLFAFFSRVRGVLFATACVPLHLLYYICCGVGYQYVWLTSMLQRAPRTPEGG
jgi:GT2 family glycosyltransferase